MAVNDRMRSLTVVVSLVMMAVVAGSVTIAQTGNPPSYRVGSDAVPDHVRGNVELQLAGEYEGTIAGFGRQGASTRGEWARIEPGNSRGLFLTGDHASRPVYSVMFTGEFIVEGPMSENGHVVTKYRAGRAVVAESGEILNLQLWPEAKDAPPFSSNLDQG